MNDKLKISMKYLLKCWTFGLTGFLIIVVMEVFWLFLIFMPFYVYYCFYSKEAKEMKKAIALINGVK